MVVFSMLTPVLISCGSPVLRGTTISLSEQMSGDRAARGLNRPNVGCTDRCYKERGKKSPKQSQLLAFVCSGWEMSWTTGSYSAGGPTPQPTPRVPSSACSRDMLGAAVLPPHKGAPLRASDAPEVKSHWLLGSTQEGATPHPQGSVPGPCEPPLPQGCSATLIARSRLRLSVGQVPRPLRDQSEGQGHRNLEAGGVDLARCSSLLLLRAATGAWWAEGLGSQAQKCWASPAETKRSPTRSLIDHRQHQLGSRE